MSSITTNTSQTTPTACPWQLLAQQVLSGDPLDRQQALSILRCPEEQLLDLLAATFRIRHKYFGKQVQLYFLMNAKSGLCPEDCTYCSQSKTYSRRKHFCKSFTRTVLNSRSQKRPKMHPRDKK